MSLIFSGVDLRKVTDSSFHSELTGNNLKLTIKTGGGVSLSFSNESQVVCEILVNASAECHRSFEKCALIYLGGCNASYLISFNNVNDLMQFLSEMNKRPKTNNTKISNSFQSTFDERTDSWSAVQYFQFYSYLSQQQNMMQDYVRTSTYQRAILANASADFAGKVVLDVGAGSGILSFFAIQAGAKRVYAVEASNMASHCNTLVQSNKLAGRIVVISGKIEDITLPEPVDVIISEPMGYMLYNERMLETYVHARKFLAPKHQRPSQRTQDTQMMEEGNTTETTDEETADEVTAQPKPGVMFPSVANLYVVPFSDEALFAEQITKANFWYQQSFHGMDLSSLRTAAIAEYFNQPVVDTFDIGLCPAVPCVHKVDFRTCKESDLATIEIPLRFEINQCSTIHGLAFWFDVGFLGSQKDIWLSTAPTEPLTHWYQVRCLLGTALFVQEGQILTGHVSMRANTRQSYDVDMELLIPGSDTKITNRLDLKNPHFRYTGYPPAPPPGSHSQPPTETYYANAAAAATNNATATNETGHLMVNGTANSVTNSAFIQHQHVQAQPSAMFTGAHVLEDGSAVLPLGMLPTVPAGDIFANGWIAGGSTQQLITTPVLTGGSVVHPSQHFQLSCTSASYEKNVVPQHLQTDIMRSVCVQKNS